MKFGTRIRQIESMVTGDYDHIWDCCCDHGYIGGALLSRQAAPFIHFVDIVPQLIHSLEEKLQRFSVDSTSIWKTHCLDIVKLPLMQHEGRHLIIIAGVGGDLMTDFIETIHNNHMTESVDYLLCPIRRQFKLRQKLIDLDFSLKQEYLIEENQQFYEILLVSSAPNKHAKVSAVGEHIWKSNSVSQTKMATKYLHNTLSHYQRIQQGNAFNVQHIIDAYSAVSL